MNGASLRLIAASAAAAAAAAGCGGGNDKHDEQIPAILTNNYSIFRRDRVTSDQLPAKIADDLKVALHRLEGRFHVQAAWSRRAVSSGVYVVPGRAALCTVQTAAGKLRAVACRPISSSMLSHPPAGYSVARPLGLSAFVLLSDGARSVKAHTRDGEVKLPLRDNVAVVTGHARSLTFRLPSGKLGGFRLR